MIRKTLFTLFMILGMSVAASCGTAPGSPTPQANMPNPASMYCEQNGGSLDLRQDTSGEVSGVCVFPDKSECDEWAYYRGECKPGDSLQQPALDTAIPAETNGQIVFYSNRDGEYNNIYLLDVGTSVVTPLVQDQSNYFTGPFSPNGARLLFTGFGLTHSYVGIMNADGTDRIDLTADPAIDEGFPAFSPEGIEVVYTSRRDGNNEIYIMDSSGASPQRLTNDPSDNFAPVWSPDGTQIAFLSDRDNATGIYSIYLMKVNGSDVKRLTNDNGNDNDNDYTPAWSPDGKQIVFRSVQNGQSDIYIIGADGSGLVNLTNNPAEDWSPSWSPDGKWIAFQSNRDGNWEIYRMKADGTEPVNLTNNPADDQGPYWKP